MPSPAKIPSYRSLDIYRLVVVRRLKQLTVADSFGVTPSRVSHVVRRVRRWVNQAIGGWLFPGRDDLRFYVALECEQIRVHESDHDPLAVVLVGRGWSYARENRVHSQTDQPLDERAAQPASSTSANHDVHLTGHPINSSSPAPAPSLAETPSATTNSVPPHIDDLAHRLAHLLILWKKSRKLTAAFKSPSPDH
jgi:hypothetical protein